MVDVNNEVPLLASLSQECWQYYHSPKTLPKITTQLKHFLQLNLKVTWFPGSDL